MTNPLTKGQIELLRELPRWGGPLATGAPATPETDELEQAWLVVGGEALFDDPAETSTVWRSPAADTLLATIDSLEAGRVEALRELASLFQSMSERYAASYGGADGGDPKGFKDPEIGVLSDAFGVAAQYVFARLAANTNLLRADLNE